MAGEFSTAGIKLYYVIADVPASEKSNPPTSGFTRIPGVKAIGSFNDAPDMLEVTDLSDTRRRYIPGLQSGGDAKTITANGSKKGATTGFETAWNTLVSSYNEDVGVKSGTKTAFFEVEIPNHDSYFFTGAPIALDLNGVEVGNVYEIEAYVAVDYKLGFHPATEKTISNI